MSGRLARMWLKLGTRPKSNNRVRVRKVREARAPRASLVHHFEISSREVAFCAVDRHTRES